MAIIPIAIGCGFSRMVLQYTPRSPDLTPLDIFFCGYIGEIVFKRDPKTVESLKEYITEAMTNIPEQILQNELRSVSNRCADCIRRKETT
ncbi:hypothetical protein BLNAU_10301 [Blattamonas nauphoetae]|uniref:Uncharacterized protein n=1 Tax=Blattamonas nauphoetae TaxID=2049346 RepID=A0ABQ9XR53_9EUKA|nr:hypothetical protein BLNAU_10301 [Blattamonas nauphoetae]